MGASVNRVILIGNLGQDPELKYTSTGNKPVCTFSIATSEVMRDRNDKQNRKENTTWHRIVVWGDQAENCKKYLQKGRMVYVEGRIDNRSWEDKEGNKKYVSEIVASRVQFLGGGEGGGGGGSRRRGWGEGDAEPAGEKQEEAPVNDDDIPF